MARALSVFMAVIAQLACSCGAGRQAQRAADDATTPPADGRASSAGEPSAGGPSAGGPSAAAPAPSPARVAPGVMPCVDAYPPGFHFATGMEKRPMPLIPEPSPRQPFVDPTFKTCVVRVTDRTRDLVGGDRSVGLKNEYSRVNSFNADGTQLLARATASTWYVYDARSFKRLRRLPFAGAVDPRWDARDPNVLWYTPDTRLMRLDLRAGKAKTVRDFARDVPQWKPEIVFGRWEGSPSLDGQTFAFMVKDGQRTRGLIVYDRRDLPKDSDGRTGEIIGRYDLDTNPPIRGENPDSVSMSLSGRFVWAQFSYCERASPVGTFAKPCGAMVYDRRLSRGRSVVRNIGHADLALDAQGRDVAIFQDNDKDQLSVVDLETGAVTPLHGIDFSQGTLGFHLSGRAGARPGWAVVSVYDKATTTKFWLSHLVYAIELKAGGRVVPLAHHHSLRDDANGAADYFAEPHASANADLTRVVFTSNWHRVGTNTVELYLIALPPDWPSRLAAAK